MDHALESSSSIVRSISSELSDVKMCSYFSLPDGGPKPYSRRKTLPPIVVDANNYGMMQSINHIVEHFMWGSKQYISLFRTLNDCDDVCVAIESDEQLLEWFNLNVENGVVHIDAQINNFDGPLKFSPSKRRLHPTAREVREKAIETPSTPSLDLDPLVDPTKLTQETSTKERATPIKIVLQLHKKELKPHKKERKLNENHVTKRRSGLMRRACTLTLTLLLHCVTTAMILTWQLHLTLIHLILNMILMMKYWLMMMRKSLHSHMMLMIHALMLVEC